MRLAQNSLRQAVATVLRQQVRIDNLRREERSTILGAGTMQMVALHKTRKSQLSYSDKGYMDIVLVKQWK